MSSWLLSWAIGLGSAVLFVIVIVHLLLSLLLIIPSWRILARAGFTGVEATTDSRTVAEIYIRQRPDLILLDLHMPHLDGLEVMDRLNEIAEASYLPILILSADLTPDARRDALSRGAKDFVAKPFQQDELLLRIRTLLETRFLYLQIQSQNQLLEAKVRERTRALEEAQYEIIERLAAAAEFLMPRYAAAGEDIRVDVILIAPGTLPRHIENAWMG